MSTSYLASRTTESTRRRTSQTPTVSSSASPAGDFPGQDPAFHPAPSPRPIFQLLAFVLIILLGLLQLLPATHFRHPSDPHRNWVPFQTNTTHVGDFGDSSYETSGLAGGSNGEDGFVHIVSWMDCLDLRVAAVLINSTLSSSSYPDLVFFHFFIHGGNADKVSFYKLKVLFPNSNLEFHGLEGIKKICRSASSGFHDAEQNFDELVPFLVPRVLQSLGKFIYVSTNVIMKGKVEELIGFDLKNYAVAAAEDCSERLKTHVNSDVLDAIQRSASKPWVSETPYAKDACMPDLNVLLIDARKLEVEFVDAVLWWSKVLNLNERTGPKNPAVALALYNQFLELPSSWLVKGSASSSNKDVVIHYDGPRTSCLSSNVGTTLTTRGNMWTQYLPSMVDRILGDYN